MKEKDQAEHQKDLEKKSSQVKDSKKYSEILSSIINEGEHIFKIKNRTILLSSFIAGLEIGFSYTLICTLYSSLEGVYSTSVIFKMFGAVYPLGFILVVLGKSALFTEQTSVLTLPVLNRQRKILDLFKIWAIVIFGNVIGGVIFVLSIGSLAPELGVFTQITMVKIGVHVINYSFWVILVSAIFAGWLMGLLTWLLNTTTDILARMVIITLITGTIGFVGFHHSIVGSIEVFGAYLYSDSISITDYFLFLLTTLMGNGIGGAIVVGLFKYRIFASNFSSEE